LTTEKGRPKKDILQKPRRKCRSQPNGDLGDLACPSPRLSDWAQPGLRPADFEFIVGMISCRLVSEGRRGARIPGSVVTSWRYWARASTNFFELVMVAPAGSPPGQRSAKDKLPGPRTPRRRSPHLMGPTGHLECLGLVFSISRSVCPGQRFMWGP